MADFDLDMSLRIVSMMLYKAQARNETIDAYVQDVRAESEIPMWRARELEEKCNEVRAFTQAAIDELEKVFADDSQVEAAIASIRRTLESERSTEPST